MLQVLRKWLPALLAALLLVCAADSRALAQDEEEAAEEESGESEGDDEASGDDLDALMAADPDRQPEPTEDGPEFADPDGEAPPQGWAADDERPPGDEPEETEEDKADGPPAEDPDDHSGHMIGALLGYGVNLGPQSVNAWTLGFGANWAYNTDPFVFGARFAYFIGDTDTEVIPVFSGADRRQEVSVNVVEFGIEIGLDFYLGSAVVLRPELGIGFGVVAKTDFGTGGWHQAPLLQQGWQLVANLPLERP